MSQRLHCIHVLRFLVILSLGKVTETLNCFNPQNLYDRKCYRYVNFKTKNRSFTTAQTICKTFGGNLVKIENENSNTFVFGLISKLTSDIGETYLGCNSQNKEREFLWIDGSPLIYKNWDKNEPNFDTATYDCCTMKPNTSLWNYVRCSGDPGVTGLVCEHEDHVTRYYHKANDLSVMVAAKPTPTKSAKSTINCAMSCLHIAGCSGFNVCANGDIVTCQIVIASSGTIIAKAECGFYKITK